MLNLKEKLVNWLFETTALRMSPYDKPFWYTSGTIGPYYINTHFLYGNEEKANNLLKTIDIVKDEIMTCPEKLIWITQENYNMDSIYKGLIDEMCDYITKNIDISKIDYISGGERRDWFFSLIIAQKLSKPHITIYKDLQSVLTVDGKTNAVTDLHGASVLHIADLVTEASSYERAWIPAIKGLNGVMKWSLAVIDRQQGGTQLLESLNVVPYSMLKVDLSLFETALSLNRLTEPQYQLVKGYVENPKESMREFLVNNQKFLKNTIDSGTKDAERAKLCIEKNIYSLT
jgi:orotate phosphoribosyltransferase